MASVREEQEEEGEEQGAALEALPGRPSPSFDLSVHLSSPSFSAGDEVRGEVRLRLGSSLQARGVRVQLLGHERAVSPEQDEQSREIVRERVVLAGRAPHGLREVASELVSALKDEKGLYYLLDKGSHAWPFSLRIPAQGAPPTYRGRYGSEIAYAVSATVDVPFARDLHASRPVLVSGRAPLPPTAAVSVERHKAFMFDRGPLDVSVRLPSSAAFVGSVVGGIAVGVRNRSHHRVRSVRVSLWRRERVVAPQGGVARESEIVSHTLPFDVAPGATATRHLSFQVPGDECASILSSRLLRVEHSLRFAVDIPWAVDLTLEAPLTLLEHPSHSETLLPSSL